MLFVPLVPPAESRAAGSEELSPGTTADTAEDTVAPPADGVSAGAFAKAARPRLGLVLSGGGARGLAHVGVLQALEDAGIRIDAIAGNSMGAIVGGLFACGVSGDSLRALTGRPALFLPPNRYANLSVFQKQRIPATTARLYFDGLEWRLPWALVNDFNINWTIFRHTAQANLEAEGDFDRLPVAFRAVALDLVSGERIVLRKGDLARAIRSSMAVPVTFPPIREPDRILVDAGAKDNLPIDLLTSEMGVDLVVAVDCTLPLEQGADAGDLTRVALRLVQILSPPVDSTKVDGWDVWIEPDLGGTRAYDFFDPDSLIDAGYRAAAAQVPRIRALLAAGGEPGGGEGLVRATSGAPPPVDPESLYVSEVRLRGRRNSYSWVPRTDLGIRPGDRFSFDRLERGVRRIHASNVYETVWPSLERTAADSIAIVLELDEKVPTSIGLTFLYDNGRNMNVAIEVSRRNVLRLGESLYATAYLGNFQEGVETGVRSSAVRGFPLAFDFALQSLTQDYRRDEYGAFSRRSLGLELSTGALVGRTGLLLAGWRFWEDRGRGSSVVSDWQRVNHTLFAELVIDGTDEADLPRSGPLFRAEYDAHFDTDLEENTQSLSASAEVASSFWRFSFTPEAQFGWNSEEAALPFRFWHRLDLTRSTLGRFEGALYAPNIARGGATLGFHLPYETVFWTRAVAGLRAPTVDLLDRARAVRGGEIGVLQRTPIGPIYLGAAFEEEREPHYFVQVGHEFLPRVFF